MNFEEYDKKFDKWFLEVKEISNNKIKSVDENFVKPYDPFGSFDCGMKPEIFVKWVLGEITTDYVERIMNKKLDKI